MADAPVILLDEPFAAVDAATTQTMLEMLEIWRILGRTIVVVLHDLEQVRHYFPQTLLLAREIVAWGPTAQVLTAENLTAMKAMGQAWDAHAPVCQRGAA